MIAASFFTFCTICVDLREPARDLVPKNKASGEVYYQLDYDVIIFWGLMEVKAQLSWRTRVSQFLVHDVCQLNVLSRKANDGGFP